jgi:hypothetical protein
MDDNDSDAASATYPTITADSYRACLWCAEPIVIEHRPGRPRLYCRISCRQRAYERRSGLGVIPPIERRVASVEPEPISGRVIIRTGYERGRLSYVHGRSHALRPSGRSDTDGRRPTLCGAMARPTTGLYLALEPNGCKVCAVVERVRPSRRTPQPSRELAHLRAVLDDVGVWLNRSRHSDTPVTGSARGLLERLVQTAA